MLAKRHKVESKLTVTKTKKGKRKEKNTKYMALHCPYHERQEKPYTKILMGW